MTRLVCIVVLSALAATNAVEAQDGSVTLIEIPGELRVTFSMFNFDYGLQSRVQAGQTVVFQAAQEPLREGDVAPLAGAIQYAVRNEEGELVWTSAPTDLGAGIAWSQLDLASIQVPPGEYTAGILLIEPNYDVPTDLSDGFPFEIVDGAWMFVHSCQQFGDGSEVRSAIVAGDLDGDGLPELVMRDDQNRVYWNRGRGTFEYGYAFGDNLLFSGRAFALADLDGDGALDLIELQYADYFPFEDELRVYFNDGQGVLTGPTSVFTRAPQSFHSVTSQALAIGDFDDDGDPDVAAAFSDESTVRLFFNDGSGTLVGTTQPLPSQNVRAVIAGDVDGDGDLDLYSVNGEAPNMVWRNQAGQFTDTGQRFDESSTNGAALGDIDRDRDLDLVDGNLAAPEQVYTNDGAGSFQLRDTFQVRENDDNAPVLLGDLNLDGNLDLITGRYYTDFFRNNRQGKFTRVPESLQGGVGVLIDVDLDGDLDLATAGLVTRLYLNTTRSPGRPHRGRSGRVDVGGSCPWRRSPPHPGSCQPGCGH